MTTPLTQLQRLQSEAQEKYGYDEPENVMGYGERPYYPPYASERRIHITPEELDTLIRDTYLAALDAIPEILEDNRGETLWGDDDSNKVMRVSIDAFIIAVKDDLQKLRSQSDSKETV